LCAVPLPLEGGTKMAQGYPVLFWRKFQILNLKNKLQKDKNFWEELTAYLP
jgi:hypothetical protein